VNTIGKTDLARRTRQVLDRVRRGQTVIVESYGEEEAATVSIVDYRLLRAATAYQNRLARPAPANDNSLAPRGLADQAVRDAQDSAGGDVQEAWNAVVAAYLDGDISLGRAAELLHLSRFELMQSFNQAGIPLRLGSATAEEARAEVEALRGNE
jgi:predicted HTH domain antitoxin/antitoxin (DNA-binding transcriptional repressor) of toxin-antitoxin stability system